MWNIAQCDITEKIFCQGVGLWKTIFYLIFFHSCDTLNSCFVNLHLLQGESMTLTSAPAPAPAHHHPSAFPNQHLRHYAVVSGPEAYEYIVRVGLNVPNIVARHLAPDSDDHGVAIPVDAQEIEHRMRSGRTVLVTLGHSFIGFASLPKMGHVDAAELSSVFVMPDHRKHGIMKFLIYPALRELALRLGLPEVWSTSHEPSVVRAGMMSGMTPLSLSDLIPVEIRKPLCYNAPCFSGDRLGGCIKQSNWDQTLHGGKGGAAGPGTCVIHRWQLR